MAILKNYRTGETIREATGAERVDGADLLQAWISREPSFRVVARMVRLDGRCVVELVGKRGTYTSTTQLTFDSAIRTALMTAIMAGDR